MEHINPTTLAHTLPSGAACSPRAGSAPNPGILELREAQALEICHLKDYKLPGLTPLQRVQLSEIARQALDEEIDLLRIVLGQLREAVVSKKDEALLLRLAQLLDVLGLTASRTASVLRVNKGVNAGKADEEQVVDVLKHLQAALFEENAQEEVT